MTEQQPEPLLAVTDLVKTFPVRGNGILPRRIGAVQAVSGVSFELAVGTTLGLVGETGCGKSTTARAVLQLARPTSGSVRFQGRELTGLSARELRGLRRDAQIVFQDPYAALNPKWSVNALVAEPFRIHGVGAGRSELQQRVDSLLELVGLRVEHRTRYPHELSGGQRQRVGIARALALEPKLIVLDEPMSALDVSVQAAMVDLLAELQQRLGLSYLLIAHDLALLRHIAHRVAVMYLGKIMEIGDRDQIYTAPSHPYTQALLSAVPLPDPAAEARRERIELSGDVPSAVTPPSGCRFRTRCWKAQQICAEEEPALVPRRPAGQAVACHFAEVADPLQGRLPARGDRN